MHDHGSDDEIIRIFSARKTNRRERAAYPQCWLSTFKEMNISPLPIFSGQWPERMSVQHCRSTWATKVLPSSSKCLGLP